MTNDYLAGCTNKTEKEQEDDHQGKLDEERNERNVLEEVQKANNMKNKITELRSRRNQEGDRLATHIESMETMLLETNHDKLAHVAVALEESRRQLENIMTACQQSHVKLLSMISDTGERKRSRRQHCIPQHRVVEYNSRN